MHLERTKDAREVGFVEKKVVVDYEEPLATTSVSQSHTCCGGLKVSDDVNGCFQP